MPTRAKAPDPGDVLVTRQVHFNAADRLRSVSPATVNLAVASGRRIAPRLPAGEIQGVRLFGAPGNFPGCCGGGFPP